MNYAEYSGVTGNLVRHGHRDAKIAHTPAAGNVVVNDVQNPQNHYWNGSALVTYTEKQLKAKEVRVPGCVWSNQSMSWEHTVQSIDIQKQAAWVHLKEHKKAVLEIKYRGQVIQATLGLRVALIEALSVMGEHEMMSITTKDGGRVELDLKGVKELQTVIFQQQRALFLSISEARDKLARAQTAQEIKRIHDDYF